MEWQPIETAPVEIQILMLFKFETCLHVESGYLDEEDRLHWLDNGETLSIHPTHWMPLPTPPKEKQ